MPKQFLEMPIIGDVTCSDPDGVGILQRGLTYQGERSSLSILSIYSMITGQ